MSEQKTVWSVDVDGRRYCIRETAPHYTGAGEIIARGIEFAETAHKIVRAVNAYDDTLAALDRVVSVLDINNMRPAERKVMDQCMAAIAKATE